MEQPNSEQFTRDLQDPEVSGQFFSAFTHAQSHLELCIAAFETSLGDKPADMAQFGVFRFRLCRANLARTQVAREICSYFLLSAPGNEAIALRDLHQCEIEHFQKISQHVQQWTSEGLQHDWPGYCEATRKLLDWTRKLIATEKQVLLPLLTKLNHNGALTPEYKPSEEG